MSEVVRLWLNGAHLSASTITDDDELPANFGHEGREDGRRRTVRTTRRAWTRREWLLATKERMRTTRQTTGKW